MIVCRLSLQELQWRHPFGCHPLWASTAATPRHKTQTGYGAGALTGAPLSTPNITTCAHTHVSFPVCASRRTALEHRRTPPGCPAKEGIE